MTAPTIVKSAKGRLPGGSGSQAVTLSGAPTSGNLLVAIAAGDKNSGGYSISGFTNARDILGASVSLHVMWKVSAGTETSVTFNRTNTSGFTGDMLWYAEVSQTGAGAWQVVADAYTTYSDATTHSRSTNTTGPAAYEGLAFGVWCVDSWASVTSSTSYTNAYTQRLGYSDQTGSNGTSGLFIATKDIALAATTSSTFSWSGGTADQAAGAVVVFGRAQAANATVNAVAAVATATGRAPFWSNGNIAITGVKAQATASAPQPVVDVYRPSSPLTLQAHICIDPDATSPIWRDLSPWLLVTEDYEVEITRGRTDELAEVEASTCRFNLDNSGGDFTPGKATAAFYPHCTTDTPVRVRFPEYKGNLIDGDSSTGEGLTTGRWGAFFGNCVVTNDNTRAWQGSRSIKVAYNGDSGPLCAMTYPGDFVNGRTYTVSAYVWVPTGQPAVSITSFDWTGSATSTLTNQWQRISHTFTLPTDHDRTDGVAFLVGWTGATTGQSIWFDGFMVNEGDLTAPFTTTPYNPGDRFTGRVTSWYEQWPGGGNFCTARVTAADRIAELQRHPFDSVGAEELKLYSPVAVYPLDESQEAVTTAADVSGAGAPPATLKTRNGGGGDPATEELGIQPSTDGPVGLRGGVEFNANETDASKHHYLQVYWATDPLGTFGFSTDRTMVVAFKFDYLRESTIYWLGSPNFNSYDIGVTATGKVRGRQRYGTATVWSITSGPSYNDGKWHTAILTMDNTTRTANLYVDDDWVGSDTWTTSEGQPSNRYIYIGGGPKDWGFRGAVAGVALLADNYDADASTLSNALLTGHANDTSNQRAGRYLTYAGVSEGDQILETGWEHFMAHVDIRSLSAWDALKVVNTTEGGITYVTRQGKVNFRERYAGYNDPVRMSIDQQEIGKDAVLGIDSQLHVNRVSATSSAAGTYVAENAADIAKRGVYNRDIEVATTSATSLQDRAEWLVTTNGQEPQPRFPNVPVPLTGANSNVVVAALTLDIKDTIEITGLHATTAPSTTITSQIEGYTEYISLNTWRIEFNTGASVLGNVLLLDDPSRGTLDSDNILGY